MYTAEQRDHVRERVLRLAQADTRVTAGALTGSMAAGAEDAWSDIDITFGISDGISLETVLQDWTVVLAQEFDVLDYFDLHTSASIYRVFLLSSGLEIDVSVTPEQEFGARGPRFRPLFGPTQQLPSAPPPTAGHLIGLGWHHALHARSSIARGRLWQAEYWISELRNHTLALACLRFGENALHGRGIDLLPAAVTAPLAAALVSSLDEAELRRALAVATTGLLTEMEAFDQALYARFTPLLQDLSAFKNTEHQ